MLTMSATDVLKYDFSLNYASFKLKVKQFFCTHHFKIINLNKMLSIYFAGTVWLALSSGAVRAIKQMFSSK